MRVDAQQAFDLLLHARRSDQHGKRRHRQVLHRFVIHMVDNLYVVQTELLDILLHRAAIVLVVLDRNDRTLSCDDRGLDRN